jgi:hypothetical protein
VGETRLTDEQVARIVEEVEERVGMGHGAWDMVKPRELVEAFRAALLRDAPRVWVAMDQDASAWFHARPVHYAQDEYDGEWRWVEDQPSGGYYPAPSWLVEALGLTPGTLRRYALLPHPEGEATPS